MTDEEDDFFTCEHCSKAIPIDDAIGMDDCWYCPACYAEWKTCFDACTHEWEAHTDHMGDPGKYCTRCSGFVTDDIFAEMFKER